jgi:hypothetical protein
LEAAFDCTGGRPCLVTAAGAVVTALNYDFDVSLALTGTMPTELAGMTAMKILDISDYPDMFGTLPPELSELINLERVIIEGNNKMDGSIPPMYSRLIKVGLITSFNFKSRFLILFYQLFTRFRPCTQSPY